MKTKKEVEDASGVTLNHFAEGKSHKSAERSPGFVLCVEVMFGPREEKFGSLAAEFIAKTLSLPPCHRELLCDWPANKMWQKSGEIITPVVQNEHQSACENFFIVLVLSEKQSAADALTFVDKGHSVNAMRKHRLKRKFIKLKDEQNPSAERWTVSASDRGSISFKKLHLTRRHHQGYWLRTNRDINTLRQASHVSSENSNELGSLESVDHKSLLAPQCE